MVFTGVRRVCGAFRIGGLFGLALWLVTSGLPGQEPSLEPGPQSSPVTWQEGPTLAAIGDLAEIQVPMGFKFTGAEGTQLLLRLMQNPTNGSELGFLVPQGDSSWFVIFEFDDVGYIKDDEKDALDADAILKSIRSGNDAANRERASRGWGTLEILGWEQPPRYNTETNNLEWAVKATSGQDPVVNYNTRLLGRAGVMKANLVCNPEVLPTALPEFRKLLAGYSFKSGQKYSEFRQGDKVAQYGLAALVTGGAAAVALKSGLLQKGWKVIVALLLGAGAMLKRLFGGRQSEP